MIYTDFQDKKLSMLGFGAMRLPTRDGNIDEARLFEMVDHAIENGINYFDTAHFYHGGMSEIEIGRALARHPRSSFYLATKYPTAQIDGRYDPKATFEKQLKKCGVDYFDFYLLHNVTETSASIFLDPQWGIIDYFKEQKRLGRIKHFGFSCHAGLDGLKEFLDAVGDDMEFCQIQLNWLDWTLQNAKGKVELLNERNIPVWVMEPVRGGRLARLAGTAEEKLLPLRPEESIPAWSFRFLQDMPGVKMILSGMSNMDQLNDNLATFSSLKPLTETERETLLSLADGMKSFVPCTACRYCTADCPMGIDIPTMLECYNELLFAPVTDSALRIKALPSENQPSSCIGCGKCEGLCPQKISVPRVMKMLAEKLEKIQNA